MPQKVINTTEAALAARRENSDSIEKLDAMLHKASEENRGLTEDEQKIYDDTERECQERSKQVDLFTRMHMLKTGQSLDERSAYESPDKNDDVKEREDIFGKYLRGDIKEHEYRELQAGVDNKGGSAIAPEEFIADLIKRVDNDTPFRALCTKQTLTKAHSLGVATMTNDLNDFEYTPEVSEVPEDDNMTFGKRVFTPHQLSKLVKISKHLVRNSATNIEALVIERLSYKLSGTLETSYMTGSGTDQPLGIFTPSADGISVNRDAHVGDTGKHITYEGLVRAKAMLNVGYKKNASWLLHPNVIAELELMKDGNGRPIWQESMTVARPSMLLGIPVLESSFAPSVLGADEYIGVLGDFSKYWVLDALTLELQVLHELYSRNNFIGYQASYWGDGQPVLEDAFVRILSGKKA